MKVLGQWTEIWSIKNILLCVMKMNLSLMGSERHEGEQLMTEFSVLGELIL